MYAKYGIPGYSLTTERLFAFKVLSSNQVVPQVATTNIKQKRLRIRAAL